MRCCNGEADAPQRSARSARSRWPRALLELAGTAPAGRGEAMAAEVLDSGRAWRKVPAHLRGAGRHADAAGLAPAASRCSPSGRARCARSTTASIARLAKLAGAPDDKAAGVDLHVRLGDLVASGQPLCTVHAESPGELAYAFDFAAGQSATSS